jgi:hypothetical protein
MTAIVEGVQAPKRTQLILALTKGLCYFEGSRPYRTELWITPLM